MTPEEMRAHWELEAAHDPRYRAGMWGVGFEGGDRKHETVAGFVDLIQKEINDPLGPVRNVLDYGCGPGRILFPLASENPEIEFWGIDISPTMIDIAVDGQFYDWGLGNVHLHLVRNWHAETAPPKFDIIYMIEVVQHLDDDTLREVLALHRDLLRSDGVVCFQFVDNGRPAEPFSYPRDYDDLAHLAFDLGYEAVTAQVIHHLHEHWAWMKLYK